MLRVILAALLGFAFIGLLVFCTDQLYGQTIPGMHGAVPPAIYYQLAMVTDTLFTCAGGWLCGKIARGDTRAAWSLILMGEFMGIGSAVVLWHTAPHYYSFYLLIVYPFAAWFGFRRNGEYSYPR